MVMPKHVRALVGEITYFGSWEGLGLRKGKLKPGNEALCHLHVKQ